MKIKTRWVAVFVFAFSFLVCQHVKAAAIAGKVVEVNEGDEITIFNLNRKVRIKLMAIDAPEKDQAFGAAAKQHLFDLVNDKFVSVEYQGVGQHSILIGRVVADGNDICAQMVRDGAAWFDVSNQNLLTQEQREIYSQSEQAARSEKRGLWQSGDAVAPWEFVKAQAQKASMTPTSTQKASVDTAPPTRVRPVAELNSMGLLRTASAATTAVPAWADGSLPRTWESFHAPGENFSAVLPDGGHQESMSITFGEQTVIFNVYLVKEGESLYQLFWARFPGVSQPGSDFIDEFLEGYLAARNARLQKTDPNEQCDLSAVRNISAKGYSAREYDMSKCTTPDIMRIYTRESGGQRTLYFASVRFSNKTENVVKFLKSVTAGSQNREELKAKATK